MVKNQKASFFSPIPEQESLQSLYPTLAEEWHPNKNGSLTPQEVKARACKMVWWLCPNGHSYQKWVQYRTVRGYGCPICSGRKVSKENCLKSVSPDLAKEWHPTRNRILTPTDVTHGSTKVVWWRCKNGHEWQAMIDMRSRGSGCPRCLRKLKDPEKSLLALNPSLAKEWHQDKNKTLTPDQVSKNSNLKVWWKCPKGHKWEARIANRSHGTGCPHCNRRGRKASKETCLATLRPDLAREWHLSRNGELTPLKVTPKNIKKVWWRCREGHKWEAKIADRVKKEKECPICSSRAATFKNCLLTTHPYLAKEWDPEKNRLTPRNVMADSLDVVWWVCKEGHAWRGMVVMRTKEGLGCPECGKIGP